MKKLWLFLSLLFLLPICANAELIVTLDDLGGGNARFTFSGSDVVGGGASFFEENVVFSANSWSAPSNNYTTINATRFDRVTGTAQIDVDGAFRSIDRVFIDTDADTGSSEDEFGVGVDVSDLAFSAGQTVTWSGFMDITGFTDYASDFIVGTYSYNEWQEGAAVTGFEMTLTVNSSAVPEPSTYLLFLIASFGGVIYRRFR